jgi:hypothetical protein
LLFSPSLSTLQIAEMFNTSKEFYEKIGSTWTLEALYLFLMTPIALTSIFLNVFRVYLQLEIKYLRVYSLNAALICAILGFSFVSWSPKNLFPNWVKYYAKMFRCYLFNIVFNTFFLFVNFMDVILGNWNFKLN